MSEEYRKMKEASRARLKRVRAAFWVDVFWVAVAVAVMAWRVEPSRPCWSGLFYVFTTGMACMSLIYSCVALVKALRENSNR